MPSIQHRTPHFNEPIDIFEGICPECGHPLGVTLCHVGGYLSKQPFVVCMNLDGGEAHLAVRISESLRYDYIDFVVDMEEANKAWAERLDEEFFNDFFGEVA